MRQEVTQLRRDLTQATQSLAIAAAQLQGAHDHIAVLEAELRITSHGRGLSPLDQVPVVPARRPPLGSPVHSSSSHNSPSVIAAVPVAPISPTKADTGYTVLHASPAAACPGFTPHSTTTRDADDDAMAAQSLSQPLIQRLGALSDFLADGTRTGNVSETHVPSVITDAPKGKTDDDTAALLHDLRTLLGNKMVAVVDRGSRQPHESS